MYLLKKKRVLNSLESKRIRFERRLLKLCDNSELEMEKWLRRNRKYVYSRKFMPLPFTRIVIDPNKLSKDDHLNLLNTVLGDALIAKKVEIRNSKIKNKKNKIKAKLKYLFYPIASSNLIRNSKNNIINNEKISSMYQRSSILISSISKKLCKLFRPKKSNLNSNAYRFTFSQIRKFIINKSKRKSSLPRMFKY
jgi:hypothetical protein